MESSFSNHDTITIQSKALVLGDVGSGKTRFCQSKEDTVWPTHGYEYHPTQHKDTTLRLANGLSYSYEIILAISELSGPRAGELARLRQEFTSSFFYIFVFRPGTLDRIWTYWLPLVLSELAEDQEIFLVFVETHVNEAGVGPNILRMRSEVSIYNKLRSSRFLYFQTTGAPADSAEAWAIMARQLAVCDLWERGFLPRRIA